MGPIQSSMQGGSSSAEAKGTQGNYDSGGGGGSRGGVFNIATGGSGLSATTGDSSMPQWVWIGAIAVAGFIAYKKFGK